jgi:CBS domain containing-hemolysin-like protein
VRTAESIAFPGDLRPDELLDRAGLRVPEGDVYDTIGGYIMAELERIPAMGDSVEIEGGTLTVLRMDGRRVDRVAYTPSPVEENIGDLVRAAKGGDQR